VQSSMILPYFVLWASLANALFVKAQLVPPLCAGCGRRRPKDGTCHCQH
jgi:hypothetical protein